MDKREAASAAVGSAGHTPLNYFNYFTEIEETFIRRRGKHLLLSPMDWALIESWKEMGVPLHVALRGIERAFDSYEARPRHRSVKSLMYCQEEVEAQFAEWLESRRGASVVTTVDEGRAVGEGGDEATDDGVGEVVGGLPFPRAVIAAHLAECREALNRAIEKKSESAGDARLCEALARASARLEELAAGFNSAARPDAEKLENALTDLEALIDRALRASLSAEFIEEKRAEAAEQLRPYRARMERQTYEQTLDNLLAKALREEACVPRLSLFYL
jgi:hypothetical protein